MCFTQSLRADKKSSVSRHWFPSCGNSKNIQFLLDKGADLRLRNKDGNDAIALATKADYKEAALLLNTYAASGKAAQHK